MPHSGSSDLGPWGGTCAPSQGHGKRSSAAVFMGTDSSVDIELISKNFWHCLLFSLGSASTEWIFCRVHSGAWLLLSAVTGWPGMYPRSRTILIPRRTQLSYKELKPGLYLLSKEPVTLEIAGCRSHSSFCDLDLGLFWRWGPASKIVSQ